VGVLVALSAIFFFAGAQVLASSEASTSSTATSTAAQSDFVAPVPITALSIPRPSDAPPIATEVVVTVKIRIDEHGEVERVILIRGAGEPFDQAVLEGAARFFFEPGRYRGRPVPVDIDFTQRFLPEALAITRTASTSSIARKPNAILAGRLREKGTRHPVPIANVRASVAGETFETTSDAQGAFELPIVAGTATVSIAAANFRPYRQIERLREGERLEVGYLIESRGANPYEIVVVGQRDRTEVARTTLSGRDIQQIPGTLGDPFRVIGTLPGVSSVMSLLPFPVVRGSSPGNTGFLIDGVRVPLLFHLLAGPSVIHPELIDQIEFSPGGFPVEYGGYTGGIVDGKTRAARPGEERIDVDLNLFQVGGLVREPISFLDGSGTFAARYGFPGFLVSLASPGMSLSYWDYQGRFDGGTSETGYTIFVFGANDALDAVPAGQPTNAAKQPLLHFQFHRVDLRFHDRTGAFDGNYLLTLGYDSSLSPDAVLSSLSATPRIRWSWSIARELELRAGLDGLLKKADLTSGTNGTGTGALGQLLGTSNEPNDKLYSGGALAEVLFRPIDRLLLRPGVRFDAYDDTKTRHTSLDPRFLARYRLIDGVPEIALKGNIGLYHQPPRFTIPIPGLDELAFQEGLLRAAQSMIGTDVAFGEGWSLDAQTYFNWMDPILFDTNINPTVDQVQMVGPQAPPGVAPPTPPKNSGSLQGRIDQLLVPATGRSYGLELLLRRESKGGVSGWLAYTLSRSERLRDGAWTAFDFDRTHILNFVVTVPLPRRWQVGLRAQLETGRPLTTTSGLASARTDTFVRFDMRVDKTAVWNSWLLDFYVDITNVVLGAEELTPTNDIRYVLPTAGFRAIF
jgi:TonB family protein